MYNSISIAKENLVRQLQREVLSLQGFKRASTEEQPNLRLGSIERAFPNHVFPTGAVHEFISNDPESAAATSGFITGIVAQLTRTTGRCLWVSSGRKVFPPALAGFGIDPGRMLFTNADCTKDILWVIEEALKCTSLTAVIGEVAEVNFKYSRRLQLAVEQSQVTGFIHRYRPRTENTLACVARWKVRSLPSETDGLPGVGFMRWQVDLPRVRNGKPGSWQVRWTEQGFQTEQKKLFTLPHLRPTQTAFYG